MAAPYRVRARELKARFPALAEEIFTWSFWKQCRCAKASIEQVRELVEYLAVLRRLSR